VAGFSGDGGTSIYAQLNNPKGITVDKNGNIFIADYGNSRIRVVYASGTISTIYGNGSCCSGTISDGGNAKNTAIRPSFIAFDKDNSLYFVDNTVRVKKINSDGIISTIAGNGSSGSTGDGGLATSATLNASYSVSFDKDGQVYIADYSANKIRKINKSGYINNFAGNGLIGQYSGDGAAAINAEMGSLYGICTDNLGNVYASDYDNFVVRKIASNGVISTVAGSGLRGNTGDGGLATDAKLTNPRALSVDRDGNLYIVDVSNNRVRKVDKNGIISTFAGSGTNTGDSILATSAQLGIVRGVYADLRD
jgi:sugar lactone lactonase YvrE